MLRLRLLILCAALGLTAALILGCGKDDSQSPGMGTLRLQMTDAPADVDAIHLVVTQVSVHREGASEDEGGWDVLRADTVSYDLLTLRDGVFVTLATGELPSGVYSQVRLKLGEGSTIVVDGVEHPLVVPSGLQSGLKLNGPFTVPAGGFLDMGIDFDAARSLHQTGSGTWMLRPTVRLVPMAAAGAIAGDVDPDDAAGAIWALSGADTIASALPAGDGDFTIGLLPPGTYDVRIDAHAGWRDTTLAQVHVESGQTTQLGTITLQPE